MKRIMIVEDEVILTMAIQQMLESSGFIVTTPVLSGEGALDRVEDDNPDLIIMDVTLQGDLDGIEATDLIMEKYDIPIIVTTAHSDPAMVERIKNCRCSGFLLKPVNFKEMVNLIHTLLEGK
ncbi:MAG: response regulator [Spirochaetes bacterium]|jgi:DNA-binding NarL/FixJ family response regulator|nr:response regulator [Spirochaetota bacterium]